MTPAQDGNDPRLSALGDELGSDVCGCTRASEGVVAFTVLGIPVPQGSKRVVPTRAGPRAIESNEKRIRPWRATVSAEASEACAGRPLITGPVQLKVEFVFPRPKGHFGSGRNADSLKASAPTYVQTKPDLDKLVRAIGDSLSGIVLRDDSQIAHVNVWKVYGEPVRAEIEISPLPTPDQSGASGFATTNEGAEHEASQLALDAA